MLKRIVPVNLITGFGAGLILILLNFVTSLIQKEINKLHEITPQSKEIAVYWGDQFRDFFYTKIVKPISELASNGCKHNKNLDVALKKLAIKLEEYEKAYSSIDSQAAVKIHEERQILIKEINSKLSEWKTQSKLISVADLPFININLTPLTTIKPDNSTLFVETVDMPNLDNLSIVHLRAILNNWDIALKMAMQKLSRKARNK